MKRDHTLKFSIMLCLITSVAFGQPPQGWVEQSGWLSGSFGPDTGSATIEGQAIDVAGGGPDIWGTSDGGHFLLKEASGDGTIIARCTGNGEGSNLWAKGGITIRNALEAESAHAHASMTGGEGGGGILQWRLTDGGDSGYSGNTAPAVDIPRWLKLERIGNEFSAFFSDDGSNWTQVGTTQTIVMEGPVYAGFAVSSHQNGELRTFSFDSMSSSWALFRAKELAGTPNPEDETNDVLRDTVLSWVPGPYADKHNVYVGESFEDVSSATVPTMTGLDVNSFDPGRLEFGKTVFWRVDEVNGAPDKTVFKGDVWSFEVEPYAIKLPFEAITVTASSVNNATADPNRTIDGSGLVVDEDGVVTHSNEVLNAMWMSAASDMSPWLMYEFDRAQKLDRMLIWNSNHSSEAVIGWGIKDVEIQTSADGVDWTTLPDVGPITRGPGFFPSEAQAIDMGLAQAKYVRINIQNNWGGLLPQYGVAEVQFYGLPMYASTPNPGSGSVDILLSTVATWRASREAGQHTIYTSTDPNAVADGSAPSVSSSTNSLNLALLDLQLGQTYYWRVDEVNETEVPSVWAGPVWSLSTSASWVVEDFESYNNLSPDRPFQTWLDGFGYSADEFFSVGYEGNGTGAAIGHDIWNVSSPHFDGTIMETGITRPDSSQSMPFYYANSGGVASFTERTFAEPQDWTIGGVKTLSIAFYGQVDNTGTLYVQINNTKVIVTSDVDIQKSGWQLWPIDLSTVGENLETVTSLAIGVEGASASGLLYVDEIALYPGLIEYVTPTEPDAANLLAHYTFDGNANDSSGNGVNGEEIGAPTYANGTEGQAIQFNGIDDYVNVDVNIPENGCTVAFWFKTTNPDCGLYSVVLNLLASGGDNDRNIYLTEGTVGARIWNEEIIVGAGLNVADGQWHHMVHTYGDAVGGQHLYIDGLLQASGAKAQSDFDWQERIHLGWSIDAVSPFMEGMIDETRIYNTTLSAAEIAWLYGRTEPMVKPF